MEVAAKTTGWNTEFLGSPIFWLFVGWTVVAIVGSMLYRQANMKPWSATPPPNPLFLETWTSGRALSHLLARGGAANCLMVAVTSREFIVQPHFPFTLGFMPEFMDLDHIVPYDKIRSVENVLTGWINLTPATEVTFDTDRGPRTLQLYLRNPTSFIFAINDMQK